MYFVARQGARGEGEGRHSHCLQDTVAPVSDRKCNKICTLIVLSFLSCCFFIYIFNSYFSGAFLSYKSLVHTIYSSLKYLQNLGCCSCFRFDLYNYNRNMNIIYSIQFFLFGGIRLQQRNSAIVCTAGRGLQQQKLQPRLNQRICGHTVY